MEDETRKSIVAYIEERAARRDAASLKATGAEVSYHKGLAIVFRALAGDIRAQLDA